MSKQSSAGRRFFFPPNRYSANEAVLNGEVFERREDYTAGRSPDEKTVISRVYLSGEKFHEDRVNVGTFADDVLMRLQFLITMEQNMRENYKALVREIQQQLSAIPEPVLLDQDNRFIREYYLEDSTRREHKHYKTFPSLSGAQLGDLVIQLLSLKLIIGLY